MKNTRSLRTLVAAVTLALGTTACGGGGSGSGSGTSFDEMTMTSADDVLLNAIQVDVVRWTDAIEVSFVFTNTTDSDVIVFDVNLSRQNRFSSTLLDDGTVRLFLGRRELVGVVAVTAPLVEGRLVMPGGTVQGLGFREFPISIARAEEEPFVSFTSPTSVDLCVGFSKATDVLETMVGNGSYEQEGGLDVQRFACQTITDPN